MAARLVVLISGSGTLLQSLIDATLSGQIDAQIVAVGADRSGITGLDRANAAGIETFVHCTSDYPDRRSWDQAIATAVATYSPDWVILAGFMKILQGPFLNRFGGHTINSHPALLPSFPGAHSVRDALAHGVKVTGATLFVVDEGIDTGPILAQRAVTVSPDDTEETLHQRIKSVEREMLVETVRELSAGIGENLLKG